MKRWCGQLGSDLTYWFAYDDRWRVVATFRASDTSPKELLVHHAAGLNGSGSSSSSIDSLLVRDRDETSSWTSAADSTAETRSYYLRNWRNDVVAMTTSTGRITGWSRDSAYGEARVRSRVLGRSGCQGSIMSSTLNVW